MWANKHSVIDPNRPKAEQIAALRAAVKECYCGLGPACHFWRQLTPDERLSCSLDKRATAQYSWKNGM